MVWTAIAVAFAVWATTLLITAASSHSERQFRAQIGERVLQLSSRTREAGSSIFQGTRNGLAMTLSIDDRDDYEIEIEIASQSTRLPDLDVDEPDPERWSAEALAHLDAAARAKLGKFDRFTLRSGRAILRGSGASDEAALARQMDGLAELVKGLTWRGDDLRSVLSSRFLEERDPVFRTALFHALNRMGGGADMDAVLCRALEDPEPQLRFEAAKLGGDRGLDVMERMLEDVRPSTNLKSRALEYLVAHLDSARALSCLKIALDQRPGELRTRGLELLSESQAAALLPKLLEMISATSNPEATVALATAFAKVDDKSAQDGLIRLLEHYAPDVRVAVAHALADSGGPSALPALRKASFQDPEVGRATAAAIAQIEARAAPVKGRLALAEPDEARGALSSMDSEDGGLSLTQKGDGRQR